MLFVHCTFEDWMWNYSNIKVYLKTLMLGGINQKLRLISIFFNWLTALIISY